MKKIALISCIAVSLAISAETFSFDESLTNSLGWTWNDRIKSNSQGFYIGGQGALITSPKWDFAVTSVTVNYHRTAGCTRELRFYPGGGIVTPDESNGSLLYFWNTDDDVHQIEIRSETGSQNLYLDSIEIVGVMLPPRPSGVAVSSLRTSSASVVWKNTGSSVRISLESILDEEESFVSSIHYDFNGLTNNSSVIRQVDAGYWDRTPGLVGERAYVPAHCTNELQLSTSEELGRLLFSGLPDYTCYTLVPRLKRFNAADEATTMSLSWILDGTTNDFATVDLSTEYRSPQIPLLDVPEGSPIVFNGSGRRGNHRVLFESIDFYRDFVPAGVCTNGIMETIAPTSPFNLIGLTPGTRYRCAVATVGQDDIYSPPVFIEFTTPLRESALTLILR